MATGHSVPATTGRRIGRPFNARKARRRWDPYGRMTEGSSSYKPDPVGQGESKPASPALGFPGLRCVIVAVAQIPHHETPLPRNVRFKPLSIFLHVVWQAQERRGTSETGSRGRAQFA